MHSGYEAAVLSHPGGLWAREALLAQQHTLEERSGSGLGGKQRDLIELEAHILDILTRSFYSPLSVCQRQICLLSHDRQAFGIYSQHLLLNPVAVSNPLTPSHSKERTLFSNSSAVLDRSK